MIKETSAEKPRARELGISFSGLVGANNAITDVPGVEVGYVTKIEGKNIRTGVTAILPRGKAEIGMPCAAAFYSLNGNGEMGDERASVHSGQMTVFGKGDSPITIFLL